MTKSNVSLEVQAELASAATYYAAGAHEQAAAACHRALLREPANANALLMAAEMALQKTDWPQAIDLARKAVSGQPDHAIAHFTLARALHLSEAMAEAIETYRKAIELAPDFALAHSNLAMLLFGNCENQAALKASLEAVRLAPDLAETHLINGRILYALKHTAQAEQALRQAIALDPNDADAQNALGRSVQYLGRAEEAILCHRRAIELEPSSAGGWSGIGSALKALGRFEEAIEHFARAIEIDPTSGDAHRDLAICRTAAGEEPVLKEMADILENPDVPVRQRISAGFGLGKCLDDSGRYDEAFARYTEANLLCRKEAETSGERFEIDTLRRKVDDLIETFTPQFFADCPRSELTSELPVFVVGLYRSGTTLTEQILSSHPAVHGAGELFEIHNLNAKILKNPRDAAKLNQRALTGAAENYISLLKEKKPQALRVVDKYPDNIFSLGLISMLFPNSRVIICHRDGRDNVLSCYFQRFSDSMGFSTDLVDCGLRYLETARLAAHWRKTLPIRVLDMPYETLVADFEGQARRMIEFIGLDWHPACLKYYETVRTVNTPSTWQVRQPIYFSSVGRWRNYERHLKPLLDVLDEASHTPGPTNPPAPTELSCRQAVKRDPTDAKAWEVLGSLLVKQRRLEEAEPCYREVLRLDADRAPAACVDLGNVLKDLGRTDDAEAAYREALRRRPTFPEALNNLGNLLNGRGLRQEAADCCREAIRLRPNFPEPHSNLGNILRGMGRPEEAEAHCRQALRLRPNHLSALINLGAALRDQGRFVEAEACYRETMARNPQHAETLNNLGSLLYDQGRPEEAEPLFLAALNIKPDYVKFHVNLALTLLVMGRFEEGWRRYEWRWEQRKSEQHRGFAQPIWDGGDIGNRTLLIHAEQGFGDTLQFCRFVPLAAAGRRVILEVQRPLVDLLKDLPGIEHIVAKGDPLPPFDVHCPLLSLPFRLGSTLETLPSAPYIGAEPARAEMWRQRLAPLAGVKVGLAWAGNPTMAIDRRRSIALDRLGNLGRISGVSFVSLQKGSAAAQVSGKPEGMTLYDWTEELRDFTDTAALIEALDLVVAVDTGVVHLAGALGKPVWLLNRFDSCWRWLRDREDSPWYPSLRQFRQAKPGDWTSVMSGVCVALARLAQPPGKETCT
jgi:tetratricopeptide (TPR) repeat protein